MLRRNLFLRDSFSHELDPAVSLGFTNLEGGMPHPQSRMPSFREITLIPSEAELKESRKPRLRTLPILIRIHRPDQIIPSDSPIEGSRQPLDPFRSNPFPNVSFVHYLLEKIVRRI